VLSAIRPLTRRFWHRREALPLVGIAWLSAWLVGFSASMVRAATMATFSLLLHAWGYRVIKSHWLLWWVAVAMVLVNPWVLFDIGFQLTIAAMTGVIVSQTLLQSNQGSLSSVLRGQLAVYMGSPQQTGWWFLLTTYLRETLLSTSIITVLVAPLTLWYFQTANLVGIGANVLVLWLFPLVLLGGFVFFVARYLEAIQMLPSSLVAPLLPVCELPIKTATWLLERVTIFETAVIKVEELPFSFLIIYYLVVISIWRWFFVKTASHYTLNY
jgi:competence protein ComEC